MDTIHKKQDKNKIPINKPIFFICFVSSNASFWDKYPERSHKAENLWDLCIVKYGINGKLLPLSKLAKYKNDYFDQLKTFNTDELEQEIIELYALGTNYHKGIFMDSEAVFNALFCNFLMEIERQFETTRFTLKIKDINATIFYPKYSGIMRTNKTIDIMKQKKINIDDILKVVVGTSTQAKLQEFTKYMMQNQDKFKESGLLGRVKEFFGGDQSTTRLSDMSFERLNVEKHIKLPHCVIFISGFTSEGSDVNEAWEGFTSKDDMCNFVAYNWEASTSLDVAINTLASARNAAMTLSPGNFLHKDNPFMHVRQHAKIYGQMLAYIIYTNSVFANQTISIAGFSLVNF